MWECICFTSFCRGWLIGATIGVLLQSSSTWLLKRRVDPGVWCQMVLALSVVHRPILFLNLIANFVMDSSFLVFWLLQPHPGLLHPYNRSPQCRQVVQIALCFLPGQSLHHSPLDIIHHTPQAAVPLNRLPVHPLRKRNIKRIIITPSHPSLADGSSWLQHTSSKCLKASKQERPVHFLYKIHTKHCCF